MNIDHIMGIFQISRRYILYAYLFMEDLKNTIYGGRPEYSSKTFGTTHFALVKKYT